MKYAVFEKTQHKSYRLGLLIKESAFQEPQMLEHYVKPLIARGFTTADVLALSLTYNDQDKAPVSLIKDQLEYLHKVIERMGITHLLVADAAYFKVIAKVRKAEPYYGYVLPSIWPGIQVSLTINYRQLFYNPSLKSRLLLSIQGFAQDILGEQGIFQADLLKDFTFPSTISEIKIALNDLYKQPALTCDIETKGLELTKGDILSIAFAKSQSEGTAFTVQRHENSKEILQMLRKFFDNYQGKVIYHNSTFDTKMLIQALYIDPTQYNKTLLQGLHVLHRNVEDTKILAYLSLNSASGNKLDLKSLAFDFIGNYALDNMENLESIPTADLLRYNASDAIATWYLYEKFRPIVKEEQEDIYTNLFLPSLKTLTQTELVGMPFNIYSVRQMVTELQTKKDIFLSQIMQNNFITSLEKELRLEAVIDANSKLKKLVKTEENFKDLQFNVNSHKQLQKLFYDHLQLPIFDYTDKGQPSTSGKTIEGLITWLKREYNLI